MRTLASSGTSRASSFLTHMVRALTAAAFVLFLAACGGSDGSSGTGSTTGSSSSNKADGSTAAANTSTSTGDSADVRFAP